MIRTGAASLIPQASYPELMTRPMSDFFQSDFFQFEADFTDSLRCIPMTVRYKLDSCGVKLKLHQWNRFNTAERQHLVDAPCNSPAERENYRTELAALIQSHGESPTDLPVDPQPAWLDPTQIPAEVQTQAGAVGQELSLNQWAGLSPLQRFALIKLSRSQHENSNFLPALQEFKLVADPAQ
jgi:hypothetical protein